MPSAYLQWRFHSGERVVARGPLVYSSDNPKKQILKEVFLFHHEIVCCVYLLELPLT